MLGARPIRDDPAESCPLYWHPLSSTAKPSPAGTTVALGRELGYEFGPLFPCEQEQQSRAGVPDSPVAGSEELLKAAPWPYATESTRLTAVAVTKNRLSLKEVLSDK